MRLLFTYFQMTIQDIIISDLQFFCTKSLQSCSSLKIRLYTINSYKSSFKRIKNGIGGSIIFKKISKVITALVTMFFMVSLSKPIVNAESEEDIVGIALGNEDFSILVSALQKAELV